MLRRAAIVAALMGACGVRAPEPVDVTALVQRKGPAEARLELQAHLLAHPRDVGARLTLAELAERTGRPSEAIEQLQTVEHLGGPLGVRWHAADRERFGRLLLARGRARLARGAASALPDLEHAGTLGAAATREELVSARIAIAIAKLRQVDAELRAQGRAILAERVRLSPPKAGTEEATWIGARGNASPAEHGAFGAWLWTVGARREAFEQLAAWHDATKPPRDEQLQAAYLRAFAWWTPLWLGEVPPPPAEDLVGPERCWFPGANCSPPPLEEAPLPVADANAASQAPMFAVAAARYAATRVANITVPAGAPAIAPPTLAPDLVPALVRIATAFRRDATVADRLARDFVASSVDAAAAHATVGALFDSLGDPGRARAEWQAAVDASAEPAFLRGLAEAAARTGDGPAAIVFATTAAAASGDPAVVWTSLANALLDAHRPVDALTAARSALDLAGPDVLPAALDTAVTASREVGRTQQADALLVQRAQLAPRTKVDDTELRAALIAHRDQPTAGTVARLWVASRDQSRDIESRVVLLAELDRDDPRRAVLENELLLLAGDPDPARARLAARALHD